MMNERLQELAEKAGIWKPTHDHKTWVRGEYISSPGELEKFAELIVKECADVGERYADGNYEVPRQILARFGMDEEEE